MNDLEPFYHEVEDLEFELQEKKRAYLRRFGWSMTCHTPGSYWMWRRDWAVEDAAAHARWVERGAGPLGMPSEPKPYGIVCVPEDIAVATTVRCLDNRHELDESEEAA